MNTPPYTIVYNQRRFQKGHALIEKASDEKAIVAQQIESTLNKLHTTTRPIPILDLGSGSGFIWEILAQRWPKWASQIEVSLIDSAAEQIGLAQTRAWRLPWLKPTLADGVIFVSNTPLIYQLITCIHFLPGLTYPQQQKTLQQAYQRVAPGGALMLVQPHNQNPLSLAKNGLHQYVWGEKYERQYTDSDDWHNIGPHRRTNLASRLTVSSDDILDLAYFLLGHRAINPGLSPSQAAAATQFLKTYMTKTDAGYQLDTLSSYVIFKRPR
ncbi:MAG TPA: methyltransferase domain-containing protein [Anaerolineae bacterium]|nr:methyltransferase domain-containing protein [Anaerolineae bacterium]